MKSMKWCWLAVLILGCGVSSEPPTAAEVQKWTAMCKANLERGQTLEGVVARKHKCEVSTCEKGTFMCKTGYECRYNKASMFGAALLKGVDDRGIIPADWECHEKGSGSVVSEDKIYASP